MFAPVEKIPIILASASPRRKLLLTLITPNFQVIPADIDEAAVSVGVLPQMQPMFLAQQKALSIAKRYKDALIIGSDTAVLIDDEILGKPKDVQDAKRMLRLLSGKTHTVITGCCLSFNKKNRCFSEKTQVTFYPLSEEEIDAYIETGEPFDKAGAYGMQDKGSLLVKRIEGDCFNVIGLPIARLAREIQELLKQ